MKSIYRYEIPNRYDEGEAWSAEEDESPPAPDGRTIADVHAQYGSKPATPEEVSEFERTYGPSLPADGRPVIPLEGTILIGGFPLAKEHRP